MIAFEAGQWILRSRTTGRVLGIFSTRPEVEAQMRAIEEAQRAMAEHGGHRDEGERVSRVERLDFAPAEMAAGDRVLRDVVGARVGTQVYANPDGTPRRELRLPDEVGHAASLASWDRKPLLKGHDASDRRPRGVVRNARFDGKHVRVDIHVPRKHLDEVRGGPRELSAEYTCRLDAADPSLFAEWGIHDAIQREIRISGLSAVPVGRCGATCALPRLDCAACGGTCNQQEATMRTKDEPMMSEDLAAQGADRNGKLFGDLNAEVLRLTRENAELRGERDRLAGENEALRLAAAASPASPESVMTPKVRGKMDEAQVETAVRERLALIQRVAPHVSTHERLDAMTPAEIMATAIRRLRPDISLQGKSAQFVRGVFDSIVPTKAPSAIDRVRLVADGEHLTGDPERDRMVSILRRRWDSASGPERTRILDSEAIDSYWSTTPQRSSGDPRGAIEAHEDAARRALWGDK